jgi:hypothetical protein
MKPALALGLVLALAACASDGVRGAGGGDHFMLERGKERGSFKRGADPGVVVAAELAFARAAKDKGQWTAFAEYAAADAVMFVPEPVNAQQWLKGRKNPAGTVEWQPYQVWSSCDGSLAVTRGPWTRPDGSVGYFTTVWQRQADGGYKWVLDTGETLDQPLAEPDMIAAQVADCGKEASDMIVSPTTRRSPPSYHWEKSSADKTLTAAVDLREGYQGNLVFSFAQQGGQYIPAARINFDTK